jgi:hypothetical protein
MWTEEIVPRVIGPDVDWGFPDQHARRVIHQ